MNETHPRAASDDSILMAAGPSTYPPPVYPSIYPFVLDTSYGPSRGPELGNLRQTKSPALWDPQAK